MLKTKSKTGAKTKVLSLQQLRQVGGSTVGDGPHADAWSTSSNGCGGVGTNEWSTQSNGCR